MIRVMSDVQKTCSSSIHILQKGKNFTCSRALDLQAFTNVYFSKPRVSSINILFSIIANSFPLLSTPRDQISWNFGRVGNDSNWKGPLTKACTSVFILGFRTVLLSNSLYRYRNNAQINPYHPRRTPNNPFPLAWLYPLTYSMSCVWFET